MFPVQLAPKAPSTGSNIKDQLCQISGEEGILEALHAFKAERPKDKEFLVNWIAQYVSDEHPVKRDLRGLYMGFYRDMTYENVFFVNIVQMRKACPKCIKCALYRVLKDNNYNIVNDKPLSNKSKQLLNMFGMQPRCWTVWSKD